MMGKDGATITCDDVLSLGDGYENTYAFTCMRDAGHSPPHRDEFEYEGKSVVIEWRNADDDSTEIANGEHLLFVRQIESPISKIVVPASQKRAHRDARAFSL